MELLVRQPSFIGQFSLSAHCIHSLDVKLKFKRTKMKIKEPTKLTRVMKYFESQFSAHDSGFSGLHNYFLGIQVLCETI